MPGTLRFGATPADTRASVSTGPLAFRKSVRSRSKKAAPLPIDPNAISGRRRAALRSALVFERFTDKARRVVVLAQEESRLLGHDFIGTEHLLLGIVHEGDGVGARALVPLGISLESVRADVEEIVGPGKGTPSGNVPFTPRAKKVLELSLRESQQLGHDYIGTEHIL